MSRPESCHQCVLLEHVKGSHPKTFRYGCLVARNNRMIHGSEKMIIGDCLTTQELRDKYCIYDSFEKEVERRIEMTDKFNRYMEWCR